MIALTDQPNKPHELLTEAEAIYYLRLDVIGGERPDLALRRYRTRRGGYALKSVRICGKTLYRLSDLQDFVSALQERQDLSAPFAETRGRRERGIS